MGERTSVTATVGAAAALLCGALSGCSFVLDSSSQQCSVNADCEHFAGHPVCQQGVCVESGLGPPGCFFPTAEKPLSARTDFLNQCTTSKYEDFDNCGRIGYCDPKQSLPAATPAVTGTQGAAAVPQAPTNLCTDGAPNVIWLFGSADFGPLMRAAQPSLSAAATPYRAVFKNASSCQGVSAIYKGTPMSDPPNETSGGWPFYFDANGNQVNCRIGPVGSPGSHAVDIGISDLFGKTCNITPAAGISATEYLGPVVTFVLATKAASTQKSISAEAAHLVFANGGMPPAGSNMMPAKPWTDYTKYYIRNNTAGSTVLTSRVIGVDLASTPFWGIDRVSTDNLRDSLLAATDPEAALGTLSIDFYDKNRGNLKALYLKSFGQSAGYLPDSSPTVFDKINVRDGHYPLWGYVHFVVPLDPLGGTSPAANAMTLLFSVDRIEQSLVDAIIEASEVPQCAMKVQRTGEISNSGEANDPGNFSVRTAFSCGCYFDFKTTGRTSCQTCRTSDECPNGGSCNYGYCEAH